MSVVKFPSGGKDRLDDLDVPLTVDEANDLILRLKGHELTTHVERSLRLARNGQCFMGLFWYMTIDFHLDPPRESSNKAKGLKIVK